MRIRGKPPGLQEQLSIPEATGSHRRVFRASSWMPCVSERKTSQCAKGEQEGAADGKRLGAERMGEETDV